MKQSHTHDLIVIGAGSGGLGAAGFGGTLGLKVALIDREEMHFGGDCLNFGCIPSKALLHVAAQFQQGREATRFGATFGGQADFARIMDHVHELQNVIRRHESPAYLQEKYGLDCIVGEARLTGKQQVEVVVDGDRLDFRRSGPSADTALATTSSMESGASTPGLAAQATLSLSAPIIILATGSKARKLQVEGVELPEVYDNKSLFWELRQLPDHLLVVGGGPIGCEMAQAFVRLGSQVTIINREERLLAKEPEAVSAILEERLAGEGIDIRNQTEVGRFVSPTRAELKTADGQAAGTVDFTQVLVAIGREVTTDKLGLEAAGVEVKDGRIVTDEHYRTTNKYIYTVGDAYGREMFSHGAEMHNVDLWINLLSPIKKKHSLKHFSWVTFTDPQVATFGQTAADLRKSKTPFTCIEQSFADDDRAIAAEYRYGRLELYLSKGGLFSSPKLLGGCMIAPEAGELIQELHLLQQLGKPYSRLSRKIYAYPVAARINQKPARDRSEAILHNERIKKLASWWYRLLH